jgi:hypothetical protein
MELFLHASSWCGVELSIGTTMLFLFFSKRIGPEVVERFILPPDRVQ